LRICRRFFRQPEDTEDAAAEVFLKLHKVLETRDEALPFRPWVSKVTGRHCIDKLLQRKREKGACVDGTDLIEVPDHSTPSLLSQVLRREEQLEVGGAVDSVARKIEGAAGAALLQTNELLQDRARTEKAAFYGQGDDLPSQGATSPQFATRAVCV
jgi:DNA-directed RNA polymerase specialized sigma24 family protein